MKIASRSVRFRLTLWYAATLTALILVFSMGIYFFVRARLMRQLDEQLDHDLVTVRQALYEGPVELEEIEDHGAVVLFQVTEDGRTLYRTASWHGAGLGAATENQPSAPYMSWTATNGQQYRLRTSEVTSSAHTYRVTVARSEDAVRGSLRTLALILLIGFPFAIALAVAGGYFLAGRLLSPVAAMASKAREITAERLSERLPVENPDDEFGRLAAVFNDTLARLQDSFERLRRFTADASHELRTPLTAIRSVGEVALGEPLDPKSYRDVIGSMLEETERLARLVDSLLTLTRADASTARLEREEVDLGALAREVVDYLHVLAEEKHQSLSVHVEPGIRVKADRSTLRQAVVNLLDNAIKYTPPEGQIDISVRKTSEEDAAIEVRDSGPGIPKEEHDKIFERFYRLEKGSPDGASGAGLGLAIARWAVRVNRGRIDVESEERRGSTFRIVLPV